MDEVNVMHVSNEVSFRQHEEQNHEMCSKMNGSEGRRDKQNNPDSPGRALYVVFQTVQIF